MTSNEELIVKLPLLSKATYLRWRYEVESALQAIGAIEVVDGTELCPTEDEKKRKEWRKIDGRARRVLTNGLSDDDHTAIRDCKTAKEVLEKIVSLYESTAGENKYLLSQKLHQLKFEENQTVAGYCSQLIVLVQRLKTAEEEVSDTAMVSKLIIDLPAKFDNFRQAYLIQAASGVTVTFERLQNQLQLVEASFGSEKTDAADSGNALPSKQFVSKL